MSELRDAVIEVERSGSEVLGASQTLLALERAGASSPIVVIDALNTLGEALQRATRAHRELALVLTLDPEKLTGDGPVVDPIIEHDDCECKAGLREPQNCWGCSAG